MIYKKLLFTVFLALHTLFIPISSGAAPTPAKPLENVSDFIASVNASANNPASASDAPAAPGLSAGGKAESEILLSVSVELSTDPGNPTGFAVRAARTNWFKTGDLTEATLRISNLRREVLGKYQAPTNRWGFGAISHDISITDVRQFISESRTLHTSQASYRNMWSRATTLGQWGAGWGLEEFRLDSASDIAPFLKAYVANQGTHNHAVPILGYWVFDRRPSEVVLPQGHMDQANLEWGTGLGSIEYIKLDYYHESYFLLSPVVSAGFGLSLGHIKGIGRDYSPLTKRYFGGGTGSVRGYEAGAIGPVDSSGAVTGANNKAAVTTELLWNAFNIGPTPVILSTFYDWGRYTAADFSVTNGATASSYGLGVSLPLGFGLVRFSFAKPQNNDLRTQNFQFEARASWK